MKKRQGKKPIGLMVAVLVLVVLAGGFLVFEAMTMTANAEGIEIVKAEIEANKIQFYPYNANGVDMEIIALEASDGSIRTAFNTCQVCYSSGRGHYVLVGDKLVCQNCGSEYAFDEVQEIRGGCNPVPITVSERSEENGVIYITDEYIQKNIEIFKSWR